MQQASGLTITRPSTSAIELVDPVKVADWETLADRVPAAAFIDGVDLVAVRFGDEHSVLSGRCRHRGALLVDG
ncbi:MAG TPA: hypothetical protein VFE86_13380, partial [Ilumatobacteraceae bacterium]|nr:hypothetical protein [Ilumatobacteraceae bacterium]